MVVDLITILSGYGGSIVEDLKKSIQPYNATGDTIKSLRFTVTQDGTKDHLQIFGRPFIMALETGRKATPQYTKPSLAFVDRIRRYLAAKGEDTRPAYAIAKAIHAKGTKGHPGVISNVISETLLDTIQKDILKKFAEQYLTNVVEFYNRGAKLN